MSPAKVLSVNINEVEHKATVEVAEDQQSLAIGKGGQNVRLAAKLTGWKIDITSAKKESLASADGVDESEAKTHNKQHTTYNQMGKGNKKIVSCLIVSC